MRMTSSQVPAPTGTESFPPEHGREPQSALTHADAFLIKTTREKWPGLAAAMTSRLAPFARPVFAFALQCRGLVYCPPNDELVSENAPPMVSIPAPSPDIPLPEDLAGPYLLVSGVGNPGLVKETATAFMGAEPARVACFPDHHAYTRPMPLCLPITTCPSSARPRMPSSFQGWDCPGFMLWMSKRTSSLP